MTQNNLKIAITGGIGSGKSTVSEIIAGQGYTVLSCDKIYSEYLNDKNFLCKLNSEFGDVLTSEGTLDSKRLSALVFNDYEKLKKLNKITHPIIMGEAIKRMSGEGIFFCEVPLLFEGGYENLFDKIIVVCRKKTLRVSSVVKRDNLSVDEVESRINNQYDYDNSKFEEYYVIHNNFNLEYLRSVTLKIIQKINEEYRYLT